jgi:hypothetical protein
MAEFPGLGGANQQRPAIAIEIGDVHAGKLAVTGTA